MANVFSVPHSASKLGLRLARTHGAKRFEELGRRSTGTTRFREWGVDGLKQGLAEIDPDMTRPLTLQHLAFGELICVLANDGSARKRIVSHALGISRG